VEEVGWQRARRIGRCGQGGLFREVERDMEVEVARVREECEARNHPILNPV